MAVYSHHEINSFVGKFSSLWKQGYNVSLNLEAQAGKVYVTLKLGLEDNIQQKAFPQKKVSPSRLRRRQKRAFERENSAVKAEVSDEDAAKKNNSDVAEACRISYKEGTSQKNILEKDSITAVTLENENAILENDHLTCTKDIDKDFDKYIFSYWSDEGILDKDKACQFISTSLEQNFKKNGVPEAEQVFKVCGVRTIPENEDEVEITVLLRKNNLSVELAARNCQTGILRDSPRTVSLKRILR